MRGPPIGPALEHLAEPLLTVLAGPELPVADNLFLRPSGEQIGRVRVADDPPTQEQLFLLDYARHSASVGEDMRYLWRKDAERIGLSAEDFWIFDSRIVALLHFDDADTLLGIELITEPARIVRYSTMRDAAMHHAVPYQRFAAQAATAE